MAVDYICGTHVEEKKADFHFIFNEKTYYFCSTECKTAFEIDPQKIIDERRDPWKSVGKGSCC
jgi:YHS domain-containing protein